MKSITAIALILFSVLFIENIACAGIDQTLYLELKNTGRLVSDIVIDVYGVPCLEVKLRDGESINSFCRSIPSLNHSHYIARKRIADLNRMNIFAIPGAKGPLGTRKKEILVPLDLANEPRFFSEYKEELAGYPKYLLIDVERDYAGLFYHGRLYKSWPVSSGLHGTPCRKFRILSKEQDHYSTLYDYAWMPWSLRLFGSYFAHGGVLPGYHDSHGCIRFNNEDREEVYALVEVGTPGETAKNAH